MRLTRRFEEDGVKAVWCRSINDTFLEGESGYEEAEKLAAYEDAEEQGLLIRLPCKVGDEFWELNTETEIPHIYPRIACSLSHCEYVSQRLGKTVFLTKAEAEKALERMG